MSTASSRAVVVAMIAACGGGNAPSGARAVDRALAAALVAADDARAPWRCAAADTPSLRDEEIAPGWRTLGHALQRASGDADVAIGVVADAGGAEPATLAALGRLRAQLDDAHVDIVIALGGMGASEREIAAALGVLADHARFPVVALAGDLEPAGAHARAIAELRRRGDAAVDARGARWIELPGVVIATVPGAGAEVRLAAGADGCGWTAAELGEIFATLSARPGVRVVASGEAPRREAGAGEATGELALVSGKPIDIHLHGPTTTGASPARSGKRDGAAVALSPGSADATTRVPQTARASAGVLAVHGTSWSWRPLVDARTGGGR